MHVGKCFSLQYTCNCLCNLYRDKTSSTFLTIFNRNFINFKLFTFHQACSHSFQLTRAILYYIDTPLLNLNHMLKCLGFFSLIKIAALKHLKEAHPKERKDITRKPPMSRLLQVHVALSSRLLQVHVALTK